MKEFFNNLYNLEMYIFYIYPELIQFCKYIYKFQKNSFIGFLSRDAYFVFIIYKNMYPELKENIDYGYIYSSRICLNHSKTYSNYINSFINIKSNILFVDIYGSGLSFYNFIKKTNLKMDLLFFLHDKNRKITNYNPNEIIKIKNFLNLRVKSFINIDSYLFKKTDKYYGHHIEHIFRSYHKKVINIKKIDNKFIPIFQDIEKDLFDRYSDIFSKSLVNIYNEIIENMSFNKNIRYLTYSPYIINKNLNIENKSYNGLLALDIDGTIYNITNYVYIICIVHMCYKNNIKIILVTSRQRPYKYGSKLNQKKCLIKKVLDKIDFDYSKSMIDIWYNPFAFIYLNNKHINKFIKDSSLIKFKQINKCLLDYKINVKKCLYFDDLKKNIDVCKNNGLKNSYLVSNGIDKKCYDIFKKVFIK